MKKILKYYINLIKSFKLKRRNIVVDPSSSFNRSVLSEYIRLYENVAFNDSSIDSYSYINKNCILNNVEIGKFCSIAPEVHVIHGSHPIDFVSSSPIFYSTKKQCGTSFTNEQKYDEFRYVPNTKKSCVIGNDVWIGYGVKIIECVTIQDGSVILAGSIVTKDVKSYSIVGGVPAKHIEYRFDEDVISKLLEIKWWEKGDTWIRNNARNFTDINSLIKLVEVKKEV